MSSSNPRQRTRSKTKYLTSPLTFTHVHALPQPLVEMSDIGATGLKIDDFQDVVGNIQSWQNPCMHFTAVGQLRPLYDIPDGIGGWYLECDDRPFIDPALLLQSIPQPPPQALAEFGLYARQRAISAVDAGPMVLAFIGELIESLEKIIAKLILGKGFYAKILARFESEFRRLVAKSGGKVGNDFFDSLGLYPHQAWLAWNFAVKPFIGDLQKLFTSIGYSQKRLDWLKKRNCRPTFVRTRSTLDQSQCLAPGEAKRIFVQQILVGRSAVIAQQVGIEYRCSQVEWKLSSQNQVRFNIPSHLLEGPGALPYVWANYVGITNPIKSIWELVPFSWLIEWFLGYKTLLQKELTNFTALADAEHLGAVSSMKCKAFVDCFQIDGVGGELPLGQIKVEWYTRLEGEFDLDSAPAFKWPLGWYQASILGSLFMQWWMRRK